MDNCRKKKEKVKVFVEGEEMEKETITQKQLDEIEKWKMEAQGKYNFRRMIKK